MLCTFPNNLEQLKRHITYCTQPYLIIITTQEIISLSKYTRLWYTAHHYDTVI